MGRPLGTFSKLTPTEFLEAVERYNNGASARRVVEGLPIRFQTLLLAMKRRGIPRRQKHERSKPSDGYINKSGYWIVCSNGRKRRRCRLIVESAIGRRLSCDEVVHHINKIRSDDRLENLAVLSRQGHSRLHALERWGVTPSSVVAAPAGAGPSDRPAPGRAPTPCRRRPRPLKTGCRPAPRASSTSGARGFRPH